MITKNLKTENEHKFSEIYLSVKIADNINLFRSEERITKIINDLSGDYNIAEITLENYSESIRFYFSFHVQPLDCGLVFRQLLQCYLYKEYGLITSSPHTAEELLTLNINEILARDKDEVFDEIIAETEVDISDLKFLANYLHNKKVMWSASKKIINKKVKAPLLKLLTH
jgi:hypothetical protein